MMMYPCDYCGKAVNVDERRATGGFHRHCLELFLEDQELGPRDEEE